MKATVYANLNNCIMISIPVLQHGYVELDSQLERQTCPGEPSASDLGVYTLKCLSIGTPKAINFPFVSDEKLKFFRCPSIQAHCNEAVIYLNFGTPKNNEFSIWNKWKIYYF